MAVEGTVYVPLDLGVEGAVDVTTKGAVEGEAKSVFEGEAKSVVEDKAGPCGRAYTTTYGLLTIGLCSKISIISL